MDRPDYLALKAFGVGIPYYGEMKMYVPPFRRFLRRAAADEDRPHSPDDAGPGRPGRDVCRGPARHSGWWGAFTPISRSTRALLSGSIRLGTLMQEYMRWPYGKCDRILVPSEATQRHPDQRQDRRRRRSRSGGVGSRPSASRPTSDRSSCDASGGSHDERPALIYVGRVEGKGPRSSSCPLPSGS